MHTRWAYGVHIPAALPSSSSVTALKSDRTVDGRDSSSPSAAPAPSLSWDGVTLGFNGCKLEENKVS